MAPVPRARYLEIPDSLSNSLEVVAGSIVFCAFVLGLLAVMSLCACCGGSKTGAEKRKDGDRKTDTTLDENRAGAKKRKQRSSSRSTSRSREPVDDVQAKENAKHEMDFPRPPVLIERVRQPPDEARAKKLVSPSPKTMSHEFDTAAAAAKPTKGGSDTESNPLPTLLRATGLTPLPSAHLPSTVSPTQIGRTCAIKRPGKFSSQTRIAGTMRKSGKRAPSPPAGMEKTGAANCAETKTMAPTFKKSSKRAKFSDLPPASPTMAKAIIAIRKGPTPGSKIPAIVKIAPAPSKIPGAAAKNPQPVTNSPGAALKAPMKTRRQKGPANAFVVAKPVVTSPRVDPTHEQTRFGTITKLGVKTKFAPLPVDKPISKEVGPKLFEYSYEVRPNRPQRE